MNAYPLDWPTGWPRTNSPEISRFKITFDRARTDLHIELERLGASNVVLSTNVELRLDGHPYASRRPPEDKGVAVYFSYRGKSMTFACDRWNKIEDNIQSIRKTIEAIRGIERWGASDMIERAFSGFTAVEDKSAKKRTWYEILECQENDSPEHVRRSFLRLSAKYHPDKVGGCVVAFKRLSVAYREYKAGNRGYYSVF